MAPRMIMGSKRPSDSILEHLAYLEMNLQFDENSQKFVLELPESAQLIENDGAKEVLYNGIKVVVYHENYDRLVVIPEEIAKYLVNNVEPMTGTLSEEANALCLQYYERYGIDNVVLTDRGLDSIDIDRFEFIIQLVVNNPHINKLSCQSGLTLSAEFFMSLVEGISNQQRVDTFKFSAIEIRRISGNDLFRLYTLSHQIIMHNVLVHTNYLEYLCEVFQRITTFNRDLQDYCSRTTSENNDPVEFAKIIGEGLLEHAELIALSLSFDSDAICKLLIKIFEIPNFTLTRKIQNLPLFEYINQIENNGITDHHLFGQLVVSILSNLNSVESIVGDNLQALLIKLYELEPTIFKLISYKDQRFAFNYWPLLSPERKQEIRAFLTLTLPPFDDVNRIASVLPPELIDILLTALITDQQLKPIEAGFVFGKWNTNRLFRQPQSAIEHQLRTFFADLPEPPKLKQPNIDDSDIGFAARL